MLQNFHQTKKEQFNPVRISVQINELKLKTLE